MKLSHKRMLILFSAALNIGFVIAAAVMFAQHSGPFHRRSSKQIEQIVHRLDLQAPKEAEILDTIRQFRETVGRLDRNVKKARDDVMLLLGRKGPVDPKQLRRLNEKAQIQENLKTAAFEAHVLDLRSRLGDEKGALFFFLLLEQIQSKNRHPR